MTDRNIILNLRLIQDWLQWLPVDIEKSNYRHLMDYIDHLHQLEKTVYQINKVLQAISHFYRCSELPDVALNQRVKGAIKKARNPIFTVEQMDQIYNAFEPKIAREDYYFSDKIILGLIIYQGLELSNFLHLELGDINLESGKIYVAKRGQRNSRYLKLEAHQILQLHTYIYEHRNKEIHSEKLLNPQGDDYHQLHWQYKLLSKEIRNQAKEKLGIELIKVSQLRHSRVADWTKKHGLRKAQYMGGYKKVISVERLRAIDLKELTERVKVYHPR